MLCCSMNRFTLSTGEFVCKRIVQALLSAIASLSYANVCDAVQSYKVTK